MVVEDRRNTPGGREPLSRSSSHSAPRTPVGKVAVWPAESDATVVLRQKRILPSAAGTSIGSARIPFPVKIAPLSAFSGRPPSAGGLNRGSRQVPVHTFGSGSIFALAWVSL